MAATPMRAPHRNSPGQPHYFGYGGVASGVTPGIAPSVAAVGGGGERSAYESLVAQHASANGIPASLVHRVIMRESRYNPHAMNAGNYGIMQIRLGTARAMGYSGSAAGLLDADTNMTYAVKYLAGAYRAAHGNENLAVALYARGYGRAD
jgi:soluble lytic murein transglycosylase-like protein